MIVGCETCQGEAIDTSEQIKAIVEVGMLRLVTSPRSAQTDVITEYYQASRPRPLP